jgi:hypothetical protein
MMEKSGLSNQEKLERAKRTLEIPNAHDIRGNITLPVTTDQGATIFWETDRPDIVNLNEVKNEHYDDTPAGVVIRTETDTIVKLIATITVGKITDKKQFSLLVRAKASKKSFAAYLMAHFAGDHDRGEQIYFAISTDGLHWKDLNHSQPVITSDIGEKGVRDPFIFRSSEGDTFYMIGTDLRIANGKGWEIAQTAGSKSILVWESNDLINWSEPRMIDVAPQNAGDAWAPEAFYDEKTGEYIVYWASRICDQYENFGPHSIYYAKTRDFRTFTKPNLFIERSNETNIIDTTIIKDAFCYYRYSGDGQITIEKSEHLLGKWSKIGTIEASTGLTGHDVEGPVIYKFNDKEEWCLMVDQYATGKGYLPLRTQNLFSGEFTKLTNSEYSLGLTKKRHGSVIAITREEYEAVRAKWDDI